MTEGVAQCLAVADNRQAQRSATMDIFLYQERPTGRRPGKPTVLELWTCLVGRDNALAGKESQQGSVPVTVIEAAVVAE